MKKTTAPNKKKVSFNGTITIHILDDADEVRKSEWETFARDRFRFKKRICKAEKILADVLSKLHIKNI